MAEAVAEAAGLHRLPPAWPADSLYNFARIHSLASAKIVDKKQVYADEAMKLLQEAVKGGYRDAAQLKRDKDLDPIRDRDDFKKLLADLAK